MKLKEYKYRINGTKFTVGVGDIKDNEIYVEVNGTPYHVEFDNAPKQKATVLEKPKPAAEAPVTPEGEKIIAKPVIASRASAVKSPLPGTIMSIKFKIGDTVKAGDTVCILEAMKMENDIHTIKGGTVKEIFVKPGDSVLEGTDIMIVE